MTRYFTVYGDYATTGQTNLASFSSSREAIEWATRYARRDLGGYQSIEVIEFADDGEAITLFRKTSDEE